jgi:hypothetical protein
MRVDRSGRAERLNGVLRACDESACASREPSLEQPGDASQGDTSVFIQRSTCPVDPAIDGCRQRAPPGTAPGVTVTGALRTVSK